MKRKEENREGEGMIPHHKTEGLNKTLQDRDGIRDWKESTLHRITDSPDMRLLPMIEVQSAIQ